MFSDTDEFTSYWSRQGSFDRWFWRFLELVWKSDWFLQVWTRRQKPRGRSNGETWQISNLTRICQVLTQRTAWKVQKAWQIFPQSEFCQVKSPKWLDKLNRQMESVKFRPWKRLEERNRLDKYSRKVNYVKSGMWSACHFKGSVAKMTSRNGCERKSACQIEGSTSEMTSRHFWLSHFYVTVFHSLPLSNNNIFIII